MYTRRSLRPSLFLVVPAALALGWAGSVAATGGHTTCQKFPATGQTTCYDSAGTKIPCADTGQDGEIQAGATLRYRDNGNGTIKDRNTGLVWEKKSDDGSIHDQDIPYKWENAFVEHVATLNFICANDEGQRCGANADCVAAGVGGKCGFAGKRDWRVPNVKELQSIVNYEVFDPSVSPAFHNNTCVAGVSVTGGSCTDAAGYWSSTSSAFDPSGAGVVFFDVGVVLFDVKSNVYHVRAVRGGL